MDHAEQTRLLRSTGRSLKTLAAIAVIGTLTWALSLIPAVSEELHVAPSDLGLVTILTITSQAMMVLAYRVLNERSVPYGLLALADQCIKAGSVMWLIYRTDRGDSFFWLVHVTHGVINANIPQYRRILMTLFVAFPTLLILAFAWDRDWANVGLSLTATGLSTLVFFICSFVAVRYAALMGERERLAQELADLRVRNDRVRIARDLHDGIGADLAALAWRARRLQAEIGDPAMREQLVGMTERASQSIDDLRAIVWALRERNQSWEDLVAYVRQRCHELCAERAQLSVEDLSEGDTRTLPGDLCLHVVRAAQEAVRNALRHGGARQIRIRMEAADAITLTVDDNGSGVPEEALGRMTGGIANIRSRSEATGGSLTVERLQPGTRLTMRLKLPPPQLATG